MPIVGAVLNLSPQEELRNQASLFLAAHQRYYGWGGPVQRVAGGD